MHDEPKSMIFTCPCDEGSARRTERGGRRRRRRKGECARRWVGSDRARRRRRALAERAAPDPTRLPLTVLRLQVAVDDVDVRLAEEGKALEELTRELADEVERDALELREREHLVEALRQALEDEALVRAPFKVVEPHDDP